MNYKILIHDREYSTWSWIHEQTQETIEPPPEISPLKHFSKDIILYDHDTKILTTTYSHVRSKIPLAGILVLDGNKTFGRNPKHKLLYKCIPDDKHLPVFLVPYEPTKQFSKVLKNKYVLFQFHHWDHPHPYATLVQTLGDTDHIETFYEYQLYCKSLHHSITPFSNQTKTRFQSISHEEYIQQILQKYPVEDRRLTVQPFSIDPPGSTDFDDAFSIQVLQENIHVSVYIANVYIWIETLRLWESFTNRVSTIYLPDRKRPMLPTILSDQLCSLQEGQPRFAFAIDLVYSPSGKLINHSFHSTLIQVRRNYHYESAALRGNPAYQSLYDLTQKADRSVTDSHDVVAYWMIQINSICGQEMATRKIGIFRQATLTRDITEDTDISTMPPATKQIIKMWNNVSGQYVLYQENLIEHQVMKLAHYTHISSPIRRLIDFLNQVWIFHAFHFMTPSPEATLFFNQWLDQLSYINTSMRSIRKIQTDCEVLHRCTTDPGLLQTPHTGTLFDKLRKNDGGFVYMVYLEDLRLLTRFKTYEEYDNYSSHPFQLFLFLDEHSLKKKIRVQIKN